MSISAMDLPLALAPPLSSRITATPCPVYGANVAVEVPSLLNAVMSTLPPRELVNVISVNDPANALVAVISEPAEASAELISASRSAPCGVPVGLE